eukprot:TRINITY_DN8181_c0_g1_i1.p4 TRINITY_DN8181_c0_g1~~TRINITY_DN8181_c0_g1_i1.p4  ORF type:complete len:128 (+),score=22.35 TRINITY_DN8181_c0_g1_i1:235-618(+)
MYHECVLVGSLLYVVGGWDGSMCDHSVDVLDTVSGIWSTAAPLPTSRRHHQCVLADSLLYVIGGWDCSKALDAVEVLDTVSGTWSAVAPMPSPRYNHKCVLVGELLYVAADVMTAYPCWTWWRCWTR